MKIPKILKIGNFKYTVKLIDETSAGDKCGKSKLTTQAIRINNAMSKELQEETFFHELVHQILAQKSFHEEGANEVLIDTISAGFYQVLKDNKLLK